MLPLQNICGEIAILDHNTMAEQTGIQVPRNIKITRVEDWCARRGVYAWVYSINNPGGINVAGQHYVVPTNDRVTGIQVWCRWNGYDQHRWVISGKTYDTNLKSIKLNMTVNPFKGYAFII